MAKRTPAEVYQELIAQGFTPAQAVTLDAIAGAESGWDDTNVGDTSLETNLWGSSYGLYQVRTQKPLTGTGQDRDISFLAASDANQAKAAWDISRHGADFTPWTTFTDGKYQLFLPQATAASNGAAGSSSTSTTPGATPAAATVSTVSWGPSWLPWNWASSAASATLDGVRSIALEGVFVVLGLGLLGLGVARAARPAVKRKEQQAAKAAEVAAVAL
jgi:hypothetical protein